MPKAVRKLFEIYTDPPVDGKKRVLIHIRPELLTPIEGLRAGIALDASESMIEFYGARIPKAFRKPGDNIMHIVASLISEYMIYFSEDGRIELIYYSVGPGGNEIESIESCNLNSIERLTINGPKEKTWGKESYLLPAINYFMGQPKYRAAPRTCILYFTDGIIKDLKEVKDRCMKIGKEITDEKRGNVNFSVIGFGKEFDLYQMEELEDMFDGTELEHIKLWEINVASEMRSPFEYLYENSMVHSFKANLPGKCIIKDNIGKEILYYTDGFPRRLEFHIPEETPSVTIEINGQTIIQPLH